MDYTFRGLMSFLSRSGKDGSLPYNTARTRRTAVRRVFECQPQYAQSNIFDIDVDEVMQGYRASSGSDVSEATLKTYQSRIKKAIAEYRYWRNNMAHNSAVDSSVDTFDFPLPLRQNLNVTLKGIPLDLTAREADLICEVVKQLSVMLRIRNSDNNTDED